MTINTQDVTDLGKSIVGALPPAFLFLLLINTAFIFGLLWFLNERSSATERLMTPLLTACVQEVPVAAIQRLKEENDPK